MKMLKKIETDCNCSFWKLVTLNSFSKFIAVFCNVFFSPTWSFREFVIHKGICQVPQQKKTFMALGWTIKKHPRHNPFLIKLKSWTKVLGHFCVSGVFFNSHRSNPSPHPTNNVGRMYPEFFRDSTLYRVGGGRTTRKFRKWCSFKREPRNDGKNAYCSTVPRTFVQDCSLNIQPS